MTFDTTVSIVALPHDAAFDQDKVLRARGEESDTPLLETYYRKAKIHPGCWRELLGEFIRDGHTPTEFICGPMTGEDLARLEDECLAHDPPKQSELFWRAFLLSVRDIKGIDVKKVGKVKRKGVEYLDPDWLSEAFGYGKMRKVAREIGTLAFAWNQVADGEVKN